MRFDQCTTIEAQTAIAWEAKGPVHRRGGQAVQMFVDSSEVKG